MLRVITPGAVFGLVVEADHVIDSAPIGRKLFLGKHTSEVEAICAGFGWEVERCG